jgi:hypothetical protein
MFDLYARWISRWETALASRDANRVIRPFDWGVEWLPELAANGDLVEAIGRYSDDAIARSERFFAYETPKDYRLGGNRLTFTSALASPYPENNAVHCEYFPVPGETRRAALVLPQWNADATGHIGLCRLLNRFGIASLRMSLAYHDHRMPPELERADYHVSSNVGRTIHASRQSVIDARACLDWLEARGYRRLGMLGTSLGSCIAFIAAAHEERVSAGVFNHVSMYFSDVVWTGVSTQHVRRGFGDAITQDELRRCWAVISPAAYLDRMAARRMPALLIYAPYDTTFLPESSRKVIAEFRRRKLPHQVLKLPCGHYTSGRFPFKWIDGVAMCRFLRNML